MEAAGVEPASERPVAAGLYMRSRPCWFMPAVKERRKRRALVRRVSFQPRRTRCQNQPAEWRSSPPRRLDEANVADLVRPRARAACSQLRVVSTGLTSEMNKLGMHPTVPCPRRSQIAPGTGLVLPI